MATIIDQVKTIVLVMMENRSFDHLLGHLSLDDPSKSINGLKIPLDSYANDYNGDFYPCFARDNDQELSFDIPHEWDYVETQLKVTANGKASMHGFVEAYAKSIHNTPNLQCDPMGFFPKQFVPITEFLANQLR